MWQTETQHQHNVFRLQGLPAPSTFWVFNYINMLLRKVGNMRRFKVRHSKCLTWIPKPTVLNRICFCVFLILSFHIKINTLIFKTFSHWNFCIKNVKNCRLLNLFHFHSTLLSFKCNEWLCIVIFQKHFPVCHLSTVHLKWHFHSQFDGKKDLYCIQGFHKQTYRMDLQ